MFRLIGKDYKNWNGRLSKGDIQTAQCRGSMNRDEKQLLGVDETLSVGTLWCSYAL